MNVRKNFYVYLREEYDRIQGRKWHIEYQSKDCQTFIELDEESDRTDVDFAGAAVHTFLLCFEGSVESMHFYRTYTQGKEPLSN